MIMDNQNLGGWSVCPALVAEIIKREPKVILEIGSGKGTRELRKIAKVISVEQSVKYLPKEEDGHIVFYVPIDKKTKWYNTEELEVCLNGLEYDLILVDGPSRSNRQGFEKNSDLFDLNKCIVIDDTHRDGMADMVRAMRQKCERRPLEYKGPGRLRFTIFEKKNEK